MALRRTAFFERTVGGYIGRSGRLKKPLYPIKTHNTPTPITTSKMRQIHQGPRPLPTQATNHDTIPAKSRQFLAVVPISLRNGAQAPLALVHTVASRCKFALQHLSGYTLEMTEVAMRELRITGILGSSW
jgi:hypothetical protein